MRIFSIGIFLLPVLLCPPLVLALPSAQIIDAPVAVTNQANPFINIVGSEVVAYKYKLGADAFSSELPVDKPIPFGPEIVIGDDTYFAGSTTLQSVINSSHSFSELKLSTNATDTDVIYLVNPKRTALHEANILNLEGAGVNGLIAQMGNSPAMRLETQSLLQSLTVAGGILALRNTPENKDFDLLVPSGIHDVTILPIPTDAGARVTIDGIEVPSDTPSGPIPVTDGSTVTIVTNDSSGGSANYSVRMAVSPLLRNDTVYAGYFFRSDSPDNDFIRILNPGNTDVSLRINLNDAFFWSDSDVIQRIQVMPSEYDGEPIQRKAWRFIVDNRYHFTISPSSDAGIWRHSPAMFFNSFGAGICGDAAQLYYRIIKQMGFNSRVWGLNGHTVPEVEINGRWELWDPDLEVYYLTRDGKVAGVEDIIKDPSLITSPTMKVISNPDNTWPYSQFVADIYASQGGSILTWLDGIPASDYRMNVELPAKGTFEFPRVILPELLAPDGSSVPSYLDARLTIPHNWQGTIKPSLAIHAIIPTEKRYALQVIGRDAAGNWQDVPTFAEWQIDVTPPVTVARQASGKNNPYEPIALEVNESATIYYSFAEKPTATDWQVYSEPISTFHDAKKMWFYSIDTAGNTERPKSYLIAYPDLVCSADTPSPMIRGEVVSITCSVPGSVTDLEYSFGVYSSTGHTLIATQEYGTETTFKWDTSLYSRGSYLIEVMARERGRVTQFEYLATVPISVQYRLLTGVVLTTDIPSPQVPGSAIRLTASASNGSGRYEYKFHIQNMATSQWTTLQSYSPTASVVWNTAGFAAGDYYIEVFARNQGSTAWYEAYTTDVYKLSSPVQSVSLSLGKPSPQSPGSGIRLTASASSGSGSYEYNFHIQNMATRQWTTLQSYAPSATVVWNTAGFAAGDYYIEVFARNQGSGSWYEAYTADVYKLAGPAQSVSLAFDRPSPQSPGSGIRLTASASSGSGSYEYNFHIQNMATRQWTTLQSYAPSATVVWNTAGFAAGDYYIEVFARNQGSSSWYEAYTTDVYKLAGPAQSVSLAFDKPSPQAPGSGIRLTASASSGSGSYEYKFHIQNMATRQWTTLQSYSPSASVVWNTAGFAAGDYYIEVFARNQGSSSWYEAYTTDVYKLAGPAQSVSLNLDRTSPQPPGSGIQLTASASSGSGTYEYKFHIQNMATRQWTTLQSYSPTASVVWNTAGFAAGDYYIEVFARNQGSTAWYEAYTTDVYKLAGPAQSVSLNLDRTSPQVPGSAIRLTASASSGSGSYEYNFHVQNMATRQWTTLQSYAPSATVVWNTAGFAAGDYYIEVFVRNQGSTAWYEAYTTGTVVLIK